jgi:hypothetical protein
MSTGSMPSGVHISELCPPSPIEVTSKLIRPKRRFIGEGMVVEVQERAGINETPAATAAESLINSRRESLDLVLIEAIIG